MKISIRQLILTWLVQPINLTGQNTGQTIPIGSFKKNKITIIK